MRTKLALATFVLMGGTAFAQDAAPAAAAPAVTAPTATTTSRTAPETPQFIERAGYAGTFEIASSQLALERGERDDVKAFAQHMIDDHTKANEALADAVAATGIEIAVPTAVLDAEHQQMLDTLEASTNFDLDYLAMQYRAHEEAISLYSSFAEQGEAGPIQDYAAATLPTLREHLEMLPEDAKPE